MVDFLDVHELPCVLRHFLLCWKFCLEAIAEKQDGSRVWGEHGCHGDLSGLGSCSKLVFFVAIEGSGKPWFLVTVALGEEEACLKATFERMKI